MPDTQHPETEVGIDQPVDLTNCDREPIHIPGRVQHFGCLIAVSTDWMIVHASVNTNELIGLDAENLLGQPLSRVISEDSLHHLRSRIQILAHDAGTARIFDVVLFDDARRFDVSVHRSDRLLILEIEPHAAPLHGTDNTSLVQALVARVAKHDTLEKMAREGARALKSLIGMDRVMVYRFEPDDSGTVIAEALSPGQEPFLGLRYPASDIPKQARALYTRNMLRIIADVNAETHVITPTTGPDGMPLDMSLSVTRAVSPIHLEYLRNMGVGASMSVSILRRGELWGLFACHHSEPITLDYATRTAAELFVQLFSYELAQFESRQELADFDSARALHDRLMPQISGDQTLFDIFEIVAQEIETVIPYDGIAIYSNGLYRAEGAAPTQEEFMGLSRFLNTGQSSEVYCTENISARYPAAESFASRAAGLLALPISRSPRDYLVLFRREIVQSVTWAGNPDKPVEQGPNGLRLTPRKSFEAWQDVVRGTSAPWKTSEVRAAEALRVTLLEVVLKLADAASESRKRSQEQQELLIAELNHRVRNILNLIRGLISQGRGDARSLEEYGRVLDDRVHALARAHDQLTQREWGWIGLKSLIENEVQAFLSAKAERVLVIGDDVDLSPQGFTTMALVIHELVTNSAKYGALSDSSGSVKITIDQHPDGSTKVGWREAGGPPVTAPKRRGFGTTIIERSVPYELKGSADLRFVLTGLEADFTLPSPHVSASTAPKPKVEKVSAPASKGGFTLKGSALVVEDNMIIAMDASDMLTELGAARVVTAGRVAEGLEFLAGEDITLALLDVNLGDESSLAVAEACAEKGIPIILATGYGASGEIVGQYPPAPILRKPYTIEQVSAALETL